MNGKIVAQDTEVKIGVDVHTGSHVVTVKVGNKIVERTKLRPAAEVWNKYLKRYPGCAIHVIYESGPNGYNLYDWLTEMDGEDGREVRVYVAPPAMVPKAPGKTRVKTDRRDSELLIRAFESESFRPVVVPGKTRRVERELVRTRDRIMKDIQRTKNRIHGLMKYHGIEYPQGEKNWSKGWREMTIVASDRADATGGLKDILLMHLKELDAACEALAGLEKRIVALASSGECGAVMRKLMKQTGIGTVSAALVATEVVSFEAFDNSEAFASYTGLVSGARGTGNTMHQGPITKEGNRRLRRILVECAWVWVRYDDDAKAKFDSLKITRGKRRAIVAMARRLAVRLYHQIVNGASPAPVMLR